MSTERMHVDEVDIDASLVRRLLAAQFPQWEDLPLKPVRSAGTDNAMYRLGDDMAVRLPRIPGAADDVIKEQQWLPRLAPQLPLAIPVPLAKGMPGEGYPWHWSVYRWLEGENATAERIADARQLATDLAQFITTLRDIDTEDQLPTGSLRSYRGGPLAHRDEATRAAIAACDGILDVALVTEVWEAALQVPAWNGPPVWIHCDIQPGNLLATQGRLSAVIDFGGLAIGDPAVDQIVAWNLLSAETRDTFRESLSVDDATWARGRGWALSIGLVALPYYKDTNPMLAGISRYQVEEVLADHKHDA
ncbi:MAG: aminoglycoside phosphotransferase family protein [Actinomycetota bacterium]|nr:aminoglycoside phosphotransferase family protein [Actinomycetota bacterium]